MADSRRLLTIAAALTVLLSGPSAGSTGVASPMVKPAHALQEETGLSVTIDNLSPASLRPDRQLRVSGLVSNAGKSPWLDAQVYLDIDTRPATTKQGLDAFAATDEGFGTRLAEIGLFAQIGDVLPGASKPYYLSIPYDSLRINGQPGVYHVGVSVLAEQPPEPRDRNADARASTLIPLLPRNGSRTELRATGIVTLIPLTAQVARTDESTFLDERLASQLSSGGRLRNVLDFALKAPPGSLQLALDPVLRDAVEAMSKGYVVRTLAETAEDELGVNGAGQPEAAQWLADLDEAFIRQNVVLLPWGTPDASGLATRGMSGVVKSAALASQAYARDHGWTNEVAGWQAGGGSTRRGLAYLKRAGATVRIVTQNSLPRLSDESTYPPARVKLPSVQGPVTIVVTRADVAGEPITPTTTAAQFRQNVFAEATVRALSASGGDQISVVAVPFSWNPGQGAAGLDLRGVFASRVVSARSLAALAGESPAEPYFGRVRLPHNQRTLRDVVLDAIVLLRVPGLTLTQLVTDNEQVLTEFRRRLAMAGSAAWLRHPGRGAALTRYQARVIRETLGRVSVTGPSFVALSSEKGRFPLTVSNGLDQSVTVRVRVVPRDPALRIDPIDKIELAPSQRRDIEVTGRVSGSGVTTVRVRLTTATDRAFGAPWEFDVRATQIGLAIWIVMGVGAVVLFGAAAIRIVRRIRSPGALTPRGETPK